MLKLVCQNSPVLVHLNVSWVEHIASKAEIERIGTTAREIKAALIFAAHLCSVPDSNVIGILGIENRPCCGIIVSHSSGGFGHAALGGSSLALTSVTDSIAGDLQSIPWKELDYFYALLPITTLIFKLAKWKVSLIRLILISESVFDNPRHFVFMVTQKMTNLCKSRECLSWSN